MERGGAGWRRDVPIHLALCLGPAGSPRTVRAPVLSIARPGTLPETPISYAAVVRSLIGWLGAFLVGWVGWWLGAKIGPGTGMLLGAVGSGGGLWAGFRWFDENLK